MWVGSVVSLHIAPRHGAPTTAVGAALAVPGRGLDGDRYFHDTAGGPGTGSARACEVSLIAIEALTALEQDCGVRLAPGQARRNIVCRGVPLDRLVGCDFTVGPVLLHGTAVSEPCLRLEQFTRPGVLRGLIHRGGLRARILTLGPLHAGDPIGASPVVDAPGP